MDPDSDPGGLKTCGSGGSGSGTLREGILGHQFNKRLGRLLLYAIHNPFFWQILKKTVVFSGFKNPCKKNPRNRKTRVYS
jgi:hypothetical protein